MQSESLFCQVGVLLSYCTPLGLRVCAVLREILSFCVYMVYEHSGQQVVLVAG